MKNVSGGFLGVRQNGMVGTSAPTMWGHDRQEIQQTLVYCHWLLPLVIATGLLYVYFFLTVQLVGQPLPNSVAPYILRFIYIAFTSVNR